MFLSFIYPHRNRFNLFKYTLDSLLSQSDKDFEVIIVDNSDESQREELIQGVFTYRSLGLDIRGYYVDPAKCRFAHRNSANYNPCIQQNVGVKKATGEIVVLTSPEVVHAKANVANLKNNFLDEDSKFILGWIGEQPAHRMPDLKAGITSEQVKELCSVPGGNRTECRSATHPERYFIGGIRRSDFLKVGGIPEELSASFGFDDNFFSQNCIRNRIRPIFDDKIAGIHLQHSRSYQGPMFDHSNKNYVFYLKNKDSMRIANEGRDWGCDSYIVGEF